MVVVKLSIVVLFVLSLSLFVLPVLAEEYALEEVPQALLQQYMDERITDDGKPLLTEQNREYLLDPQSRQEAQALIDSFQNDSSTTNVIKLVGRNDVVNVLVTLNASCNLSDIPDIAIKQDIRTEHYRFMVLLLPKPFLVPLLQNECVLKFADEESKGNFYTYARRILEEERAGDALRLDWAASSDGLESYNAVLDELESSWDKARGAHSPLQQFVTPADPVVAGSGTGKGPAMLFEEAIAWPWVSDQKLWTTTDRWLTPVEFLSQTSTSTRNPFPGRITNDCEEHANTLVSLLRASGISAKEVRVALGEVMFEDGTTGGHAWAEFRIDGTWTVLDSTLGSFYDDIKNETVERAGVTFDYWKYHEFPTKEVWAYYNDQYFLDLRTKKAPGSWDEGAGTLFEKEMNEGLKQTWWEKFILFLTKMAAKVL